MGNSNITKLFFLFSLIMLLASCEEVIEVDLNEADPRLVVEGRVVNGAGPHLVQLTQSGSYFGEVEFPPVKGATVTISDDEGNTDLLIEQENGMYYTQTIVGMPGRKYTLDIEVDGAEYTASSTMPLAIEIDTTLFYYEDGSTSFFVDSGFYVMGSLIDAKELNYYRMHIFIGSEMEEIKTWYNVPYEDFEFGAELGVSKEIWMNPYEALEWEDTATVVVTSVNKDSYNYFVALSEANASGESFGSIPQNPPSNISNDALGFFDAVTEDEFTVVISF